MTLDQAYYLSYLVTDRCFCEKRISAISCLAISDTLPWLDLWIPSPPIWIQDDCLVQSYHFEGRPLWLVEGISPRAEEKPTSSSGNRKGESCL